MARKTPAKTLTYKAIRAPIHNLRAETNLLITLLSFALTVSLTRLFLYLTNYPKIGNSELHIAHVLWGGLLLFVASLLPLIFANQWINTLGAVLSGMGVGLFIDEVGKFITQSNDYFYPAAAPIIYALFLITALVYFLIRRNQKDDPREQFYYILADLEEVLDQDLSHAEKLRIQNRLDNINAQTADPAVKHLSETLLEYLNSDQIVLVPSRPGPLTLATGWYQAFEKKWFPTFRIRMVLIGGMVSWSVWHLLLPTISITHINPARLENLIMDLVNHRIIRGDLTFQLFLSRISLEMVVALMVFISAILLVARLDRQAFLLGFVGLVISLTVVNLLYFYFEQFSTIPDALIQFLLLVFLLRFRSHALEKANAS